MRRTRLVDCAPRWSERNGKTCWVTFDCPEGHEGCRHTIPFTPSLDGAIVMHGTATWERRGDTFESLTLVPSIKRNPRYASREAAIEDGCAAEHVHPALLCAIHVELVDGEFRFCADSC